jgi:3-isopropylmalate dehydrogenase
MKVAVLPGDGIGPEIIAQAVKVLRRLNLPLEMQEAPVGGAGYAAAGEPLPSSTLKIARQADAILFGAVGDPRYDNLERAKRPEQAILGLRKELALFANLRPAQVHPELASASALKTEVVAGLDILIVRELTGDIYFGQPKGIRAAADGGREGFDTMRYSESEVRRIARVAFEAAGKRGRRVCSVDKANVLETSQLWREVVSQESNSYPDVELTHMYVDNCAMQLVRNPKQFDVIVTGNLRKGPLRADPPLGAGHRRKGRGEPSRDHSFGRHDAALFAAAGKSRTAGRGSRHEGLARWIAYRRYLCGGHDKGRDAADGGRGRRRPVVAMTL